MTSDSSYLRTLQAKERLHELEMAYCRGIDRRDPELLRSIYFDDAVVQHGNMFTGTADGFVGWILGDFVKSYELTAHYVFNEWYQVAGDRAEGEVHRISYHRISEPASEIVAASRTFNRYELRHGVWKISYRDVIRDWIQERPVDTALYNGKFAMEISRPGPADRSYEVLSIFGRGPIDGA
ncbi:nuclear transport factor 2 family protein [Micromonospora sp. NPDC005206]|uniref:nuclear transport factor 2 family protein n=1 Tax=Micromonospora sp. NPDC005206 TaxID=3157022 RepID=UPI0033B616E6